MEGAAPSLGSVAGPPRGAEGGRGRGRRGLRSVVLGVKELAVLAVAAVAVHEVLAHGGRAAGPPSPAGTSPTPESGPAHAHVGHHASGVHARPSRHHHALPLAAHHHVLVGVVGAGAAPARAIHAPGTHVAEVAVAAHARAAVSARATARATAWPAVHGPARELREEGGELSVTALKTTTTG